MDARQMYEDERKRKNDRSSDKPQRVSLNDDTRFVKWVAGKTYRMRMLCMPGPERKCALIHKSTHVYYDPDTKDYQWVTCPTSEYVDDINGYKICPICVENKELYKNYKTSPSCKEMYDKMKRQFHCFAPVYVISDPVNPVNNGTVKLIKYGVGMRKYFNKEIYNYDEDAWKKSDEEKAKEEAANADKDEIVGFGAFDTANGFDLIVSVSVKSDDYKEYTCKFSRTASAIPISAEELEKQFNELNFDKEFYTVSTKTEILKLYNRFMATSPEEIPGTNGVEQFDMPDPISAEKKVEQPKPVIQESAPAEKKVVPPAPKVQTPPPAVPGKMNLDLGDIDAIIAEITNK